MAPKYKLTYFPIMGLAEPIRFLLSYGKIEFEDERCESDKWQSIKLSTPFGQAPILEIDGKKTWQSIAICRYLGKQVGLAGANDWENLQIDMAVDTISDIRSKIATYAYEADAALKEKKKATVVNENLPFLLPRLDKLVKDNGGYLANGKLSWADLYFVAMLGYMNYMSGFDLIKDYSNLSALRNKLVLKMAPKYKLTYFPIMGLAEPIRFLLSYGKIEFEDERCEPNKWQSIKQSTPFGQAPVLEIDGKKTWQSIAICRYLGKQVGLAGANDWENLQIDMAVDTISDIRSKMSSFGYEADAALKEKKKATVLNENLPFLLPRLDKLVKDNGGYLANGKLSCADLYFVAMLGYLSCMSGFDLIKDYSNLPALKNKVLEIPAIKEWVAKRPKILSWADLYFVALLDIWNSMIGFDLTKDYSNLAALKNTVREIPAIKEWISKRPKTER